MAIRVFPKGWCGGKTELRISSPYGPRKGGFHYGNDIAIPVGTVLKAPVPGEIKRVRVQAKTATRRRAAGLYTVLRYRVNSSEYYDIYFMHLRKCNVRVGQTIKAGDIIGYSGGAAGDQPNAGSSTGPHLHFEIRINGTQHVDSLLFLSEKCVSTRSKKVLNSGSNAGTISSHGSISGGSSVRKWTVREFIINSNDKIDVTDDTDTSATETITETVVKTKPASVNERLAPGIWQITKLIMDSSVENRQMFDSSISYQTGPLINFFNRVCQKPLVEFCGDTWGDQYYFMVRKPPFDKEGIDKMQDLTLLFIDNSEIINTSLNWNTDNIYSWYQMIPFAEYAGLDQLNLFMPAVFFPEYAAIWGSRDLTVQNQYVNYYRSGHANASEDDAKKENMNSITRNAAADLKYLVESNAYNPFTRSGTITLNGDRRIKRGTLILMPNDELFYVESVSNSFSVSRSSVSRTTVLQVSHGMFQRFIAGVDIEGQTMSYFNIIDFGDWDINKIKATNWKKQISKWKVNLNVFAYFLKRSQLLTSYDIL